MDTANRQRRTLAENASFVVAAVRAMGINPHPQSRLMKMHAVLTERTETIQPDDPDFDTALEAMRDMQLLDLVFGRPTTRRDDPDFQCLVRRMLNDSVLPQDHCGRSKGRDAQFELFVASICQRAHLVPVESHEPDVTCVTGGVKFGIAVKRVKNISNLRKHVKKAAQQIESAGLPGIIALDTCLALNEQNERITVPIPEVQFAQLYQQAFRRFLDDYHRSIFHWIDGKAVRGVVFHDHQVRLNAEVEWELSSMTFWLPARHGDEKARREFTCFRDNYLKGLPNLEYL